jgi:DNA-binding response OmpR family regulator
VAAKKRILCISYDESLLRARKSSLEQAGFFVTSPYGLAEASRICRLDHAFDLIVLGHSIPRDDKLTLIELVRANCKASILSIRKQNDPALRQAEFSIDSNNEPEMLVVAVKLALGMDGSKPASSASVSS